MGSDEMSRELGKGRWDRVLISRMVELSIADDYDTAKHEWIATGKCWWSSNGQEMPTWVNNHPFKCLCGHDIVYHFEILNTENNVRECVGSDHINSYLVFRALREEGINEDQITDDKIEEWINVRLTKMKSDAWWELHGPEFTRMFDAVKDYDLRVNVRTKGKYYDAKLRMQRDKTFVRRRAEGKQNTAGYKMASIVWRWNHPENSKAQINTRGYPNQQLHQDLMMFYFNLDKAKETVNKEEQFAEKRLETLRAYDIKIEAQRIDKIKRREQIVINLKNSQENPRFVESCEYYGIPPFIPEEIGFDDWTIGFLRNIKLSMTKGKELTEKQITKVWEVLDRKGKAPVATEAQKNYLQRLGYDGDIDELTKSEASRLITEYRNGE